MKIQTIETFLLESPIDEPFAWSQGSATMRSALICKITTDDGLVGWGEGGASPSQTIIHDYFAPQLLGADPSNINKLWHQLFHSIHNDNQAGGFGGGVGGAAVVASWTHGPRCTTWTISVYSSETRN